MQYFGADPRREYLKQVVMTASPAELIALLYDACIKNVKLAVISYEEQKDISATNNYLIKAQKIITELMNCLDMNIEMSSQLLKIYEFILGELREANIHKDLSRTEPLVNMLESMRDTWKELAQQQRKNLVTESLR
jgi:flagellar protein FliS